MNREGKWSSEFKFKINLKYPGTKRLVDSIEEENKTSNLLSYRDLSDQFPTIYIILEHVIHIYTCRFQFQNINALNDIKFSNLIGSSCSIYHSI